MKIKLRNLLFVTVTLIGLVALAGKLQNEDFKTLAELTGAGGTSAQLLNDTKIYITANGINQQLSSAITSGLIGGGGGGSGMLWNEDVNAPTPVTDAVSNRAFGFQSGQGQALYTVLKVPNSWGTGQQLKLVVPFASPDASGTVLIQCVATLIRTGTDAITSTTNQRTSTNAALTQSAANVPKVVTCDLTSTTGQINSVAVSPNDIILVKLTRGTDTATSDVNVYATQSEFVLR